MKLLENIVDVAGVIIKKPIQYKKLIQYGILTTAVFGSSCANTQYTFFGIALNNPKPKQTTEYRNAQKFGVEEIKRTDIGVWGAIIGGVGLGAKAIYDYDQDKEDNHNKPSEPAYGGGEGNPGTGGY